MDWNSLEVQISAVEERLHDRYKKMIAPSYTCSKCWRFYHEHGDDWDVRGCKTQKRTPEAYTRELKKQLKEMMQLEKDLQRLDDLTPALARSKAEKDALAADKKRLDKCLISWGSLVATISSTSQDIATAISRRDLEEIDDEEFFARMKDMSGRLSAIDIH